MTAVKDYTKEYIETAKGVLTVDAAIIVLKIRYEDDIVAALYDYGYIHQDQYVKHEAHAAFKRERQRNTGGSVASPQNLPRTTSSTMEETIPAETFADRVKAIICKAATKNGQHVKSNARGYAGTYIFNINAEAFCKAMDEMVITYGEKLKELLGGTLHCLQVTKVCFFIGSVIRMHIINDVKLQAVDMLFAFEGYYKKRQTVKAKLGNRQATDDQKVVLGYFEGLLKKHTS